MAQLRDILAFCDALLQPEQYQDYCPNGLQVEGRAEVRCLVSGVTASMALLEAAAEAGADAVLVHHGYFWQGEDPRVVGMKQRRLRQLLERGISLIAYHLPLDGHPELGNNAQLGKCLGIEPEGRFGKGPGEGIAMYGTLPQPQPAERLAQHIGHVLQRAPLHIAGNDRLVRRIGWCSGAAQGWIEQAAALGLDAYLSGEISEATVHAARELGLHYYAAGHHATEHGGVRALGERLARTFGLLHRHVDIPNPV